VPDEIDPPRKNYGFKEREFQRDNQPSSEALPPVTTQDLAKLAGPAARSGPVPGNAAKPGDPNDVFAVLQRNRVAEKNFGGDDIEIKKVSSRRKRDYWFAFLSAELVFGGVVVAGALLPNPFFLVFGLTGMVILGLAITWIMWQLVDRY